MRRIRLLHSCLLWAALSGGCSSTNTPLTIRASDYNQSCMVDTDCVLIDEGSSCCGSCGNAAINKADQAKYQAAATQRHSTCQPMACPALACVFSAPYCNADKCDACHNPSGCSGRDGGATD